VSERQQQVGELGLAVWDALTARADRQLGAMSATELMRKTAMSRAEILFGLRELAKGGWVERTVAERYGKVAELWRCVERPWRGGHRQQAAE
jgi:DNA-binding IclR family transcriptional regulator